MKKLILSFLAVSALVLGGMGLVANAAPTSTIVQNLQITALSGGGTLCLHILNSGLVQTTSGDCGSGSGSFTTTTINGTASLVFALKGDGSTVTSTTSGATTTFSVISGVYLTTASGTALFYPLSSNPAGYVTSSTGLTYFFPATTTVFVPNTIQVNSGGILSGGGALSGNQTISLSTSTLNSNVIALGFVTSTPAGTVYLASTTPWTLGGIVIASTTGSVTTIASTTYYLSTNPSGYISTSTFNATGSAFYFPYWNASGTALSPTSTIFISSSTGNVGIGTTGPSSTLSVSGSFATGNQNISTSTTLSATSSLVFWIATSTAGTVTLPTIASVAGGTCISIVDAGGNAGTNFITVAAQGANTISGAATTTIATNKMSLTFCSNNSSWYIN